MIRSPIALRRFSVTTLSLGLTAAVSLIVTGCQDRVESGSGVAISAASHSRSRATRPDELSVPKQVPEPAAADPVAVQSGAASVVDADAPQSDTAPEKVVAAASADVAAIPTTVGSAGGEPAAASGVITVSGESTQSAKPSAVGESADAPRVLVPHREFQKEGPAGAFRLSYDDIDLEKIINMKKATLDAPKFLPKWLKDLEGQRIRLRGFMVPHSVFQQSGNRKFVLARDTGACCFGPNPTIYYLVEVDLKKGDTTDYIDNRPFDVEGEFGIESEELDGTIYRFYQLHNATIVRK